ncbi:ATP-binding protein [Scleromatobacter humisilvae]|uniref:histidine kinase n=1 Tax=Scleromatobacter humisilvae TaxID=2897159 RepID=A0A9X1YF39_9BURK|nr:ATP-binding protein [Scleromatobacter humisilvae]MCK9684791.1 response regulator [Scleromatobacter humisilvae]
MSNTSLRRSLGTKLRLAILGTTLVALVLALGTMIAYDLRTWHRGWIADVQAQADLLGHASAEDLAAGNPRGAQDALATLRLQPRLRNAAVYDAQGRLFAGWHAAGSDAPPTTLARTDADAGAGASHDLLVRSPIVDQGRTLGTVTVRARDEIDERIAGYAAVSLGLVLLALAITWAVSGWLKAIVLRPLAAMADIARDAVQHGVSSRRAAKLGEDEVGELVDAFNGLLAEIERRKSEQDAAAADKDREVAERRHAQQEVMRLNEELERRVHDRTAQLESSNRDLQLATREAESANRAKSEFLSNMSHELRTPLNAIIGFGQLLNHADAGGDPERNRGFVQHIVDAGNHLLTLINEILNLAQIESGKVTISLEPVELREVLEECHALTRTASAQRGIRLVFPMETPLSVSADRTRLKQVLLNLLSNAVKYNREHGAVIVECTAGDQGRIRVAVQDTGNGLTPDQLRQLFQPFNRLGLDNTTIEGSGIGLVLTKRLVELMGGTIGVRSTPGTGSTFWIDLRSAEPAAMPRAPSRPRLPTPSELVGDPQLATILCVDDNRANLALLTEALSLRTDCMVLTATDGQAGVDMARSHSPDVILMDNNMPIMSGREAMRVLQQDPATAGIPIIAVSAAAMPAMVSSGLEQGYFRYLVKPYDLVDLTDAIDAAIDMSRRGGVAPDADA